MTDSSFSVTPVSRQKLRSIAKHFHELMSLENEIYMPIIEIYEFAPFLFADFGLSIEIVPADEMASSDHGYFDLSSNTIVIREDIYDGAYKGNGRDRMTLTHELCHFILFKIYGFKLKRNFNKIKPFEDPEWQAKALAAEFMMPAGIIKDMTVDQIVKKCGVSFSAAKMQYENVKN